MNSFTQYLNRGDARTFLVFFGISALLWLLGNLSERYDARAAFRLNLVNCPDSLGIYKEDPPVIYARLRTSGFRFLTGAYGGKGLDIDVSRVWPASNRYFLQRSQVTNMINRKLPQEVELLSLEQDSFYMPVYRKYQKEIPVRANITYELEPNHRLSGSLELTPAVVLAEGPASELENLSEVYTQSIALGHVSKDIDQIATLVPPSGLLNIELNATTIRIMGRVRKFSETVFEVPVTVENPPVGFRVRVLPKHVQVVCQAEQQRLNRISVGDFGVQATFVQDSQAGYTNLKLPLMLSKQPDSVYMVRLLQDEVSYFLEKEE